MDNGLPPALERIVTLFAGAPKQIKVEALVDYSDRLPELPERFAGHSGMEQVHECQTPFFVATEVVDDAVQLHFDVPRESPTIRGYAGILAAGLEGATPQQVLAVPNGFYTKMGIDEVVSQLRLRGMGAILATIKQQVRDLVEA